MTVPLTEGRSVPAFWGGWATVPRGAGHSLHHVAIEIGTDAHGSWVRDLDREAIGATPVRLHPKEGGHEAVLRRLWPFDIHLTLTEGDAGLLATLDNVGMTGLESHSALLTPNSFRSWSVTPPTNTLEEGIDAFLAGRETDRPDEPMTTSVLVQHRSQRVAERYYWGHERGASHLISSCAKSVTGLLAGVALAQSSHATSDSLVADLLPQRASDSWRKAGITLRDALAMSSGTAWTDDRSHSDSAELLSTEDIVGFAFARRPVHTHGSRFVYDNSLPCVVGAVVSRLTSRPFDEFAQAVLFDPLGIPEPGWTPTVADGVLTAGGLHLRSRDMLALGQLVLDGGRIDGVQVIPEDWIRGIHSSQTAPGQYPYSTFFHLSSAEHRHFIGPDAVIALGQGGQIIAAVPALDLAVVVTGLNWDRAIVDDTFGQLMEHVILPALAEADA